MSGNSAESEKKANDEQNSEKEKGGLSTPQTDSEIWGRDRIEPREEGLKKRSESPKEEGRTDWTRLPPVPVRSPSALTHSRTGKADLSCRETRDMAFFV
ncbi:S-M checkpoint control protein rad4 [Fusarium oxysporum f. sp. albedinis]|nr:S-M checkpoint control protein rad4 [Fusarium oxysporum f. sp. albedinis]